MSECDFNGTFVGSCQGEIVSYDIRWDYSSVRRICVGHMGTLRQVFFDNFGQVMEFQQREIRAIENDIDVLKGMIENGGRG